MHCVTLLHYYFFFVWKKRKKTYFYLSKQTERPENRFKSKSVVAWHFRWFGAKNQLSIFPIAKSLRNSNGTFFLSKFQLNQFHNRIENMELEKYWKELILLMHPLFSHFLALISIFECTSRATPIWQFEINKKLKR